MLGYFYLLCIFCCVSCCKQSLFFNDDGPVVRTLSGSIAGSYNRNLDNDISEFLGIPFAVPPLGEKRFMKPEPVEPWDGVLKAYEKPRPCMQFTAKNITTFPGKWFPSSSPSEDCLYLNIWSPTNICCSEEKKLPVLVWIHGGAFSSGSSDIQLYDGATIASIGQVVVVSINYRVGSFGFLYGGMSEAPGNAGMYDQALALKWVKDNIMSFGGDPNSITLFGESAGAISISLHLISPISRGLFHRAILQSGSSYGVPMIDDHRTARMKTETFALLTGCSFHLHLTEVISCLKSKDALELAKAESILTDAFPMLFAPIFNDEFLPKSPNDAYDSGDAAQLEVLAGVNTNEASIFLHYIMPQLFPYNSEPQLNLEIARSIVKELYKTLPLQVFDSLWQFYFQGISNEDSPAIVSAISESYGDFVFNCPVLLLMEKLNNAYLYWMTHRSLKNQLPEWVGVTHFDDIPYVFGVPIGNTKYYTPEDGKFSEDVIHKWVSFARTGHPMDQNQDLWPKFNSSNPIAYELNPREYKELPFPRRQSCEFWRALQPTSHGS